MIKDIAHKILHDTITLMKTLSLPVIIEKDKDGYYAECPSLEGCYTQGDSYEEALKNIKDVILLCLKDKKEIKEVSNKSISLTQVSVTI